MAILNAYIDETGDLGWSDRATPIFAMSAVVVEEEREPELRYNLAELRSWLKYGPDTVLQWKLTTHHEKRLYISETLASQPITIVQVCMFKRFLEDMNREPAALYLYTLRFMVERLTWLAQRRDRVMRARFAQIRAIGVDNINSYLTRIKRNIPNKIEWQNLEGERVYAHRLEHYELLQLADLSAGPVHSMFVPSVFGYLIPNYLQILSPLLWRPFGEAYPTYGFKVFPGPHADKLQRLEEAYPMLAELV